MLNFRNDCFFNKPPSFRCARKSKALQGVDSLLSIVQMPAGMPTATFAVGDAGATNATLFAISMLAANGDSVLKEKQ